MTISFDNEEFDAELAAQYQVGYIEGAQDVFEQFENLANNLRKESRSIDATGLWRNIRKIQRDLVNTY